MITIEFLYQYYLIFLFLLLGMGGMYIAGFLCYGELPYLPAMMIQPIPIILAIINCMLLPLTTTLAEDGLYLGIGINSIQNKSPYTCIFLCYSAQFYSDIV